MKDVDPKRLKELYPVGTVVLYNNSILVISGYTKDGRKLKCGSKTLQLEYHTVYFLSKVDVSDALEKSLLKYLRLTSADPTAEIIYKTIYIGEPI